MAIKWTPKKLVLWVANTQLKGIAELGDFDVDLDARKVYGQVLLFGETEAIEVWFEDFAIIVEGDAYSFILQQAKSNKPWLTNALARIVGKAWKVPVPEHLKHHFEPIVELLKAKEPEPENN